MKKPLVLALSTILLTSGLPANSADNEIRIEKRIGITETLEISDEPYNLWECRSVKVLNPYLFVEGPGNPAPRKTISTGAISGKSGCPDDAPFRYDFRLKIDKKFLDELVEFKAIGFDLKKNADASITYTFVVAENPFPEYGVGIAIATFLKIKIYPIEKNPVFGVVEKSKKYKAGIISSLDVAHNRDLGIAEMTVNFRTVPKLNQIISFDMSDDSSATNSSGGTACSGSDGAQLRSFPNLKVTYKDFYNYKLKNISKTKKSLTVTWAHPNLKAINSWEDDFYDMPICFGVSTWVKKSSYSEGTNCNGVIINGFINADCQPYAGWNKWEEVNKSWKVSLDLPTI
jgi:hypothetical protein